MKNILLIIAVFIVGMANAQETKLIQSDESKSLRKLVRLKVEYDKAVYLKEERGFNISSKKAYDEYIAYIRHIKQEPIKSKLRSYIDQIIKLDSNHLKKTYQYYSYIDKGLSWMDRSKIISNLNYYKIVKYYLFEKNMNELPDLDKVTIVKIRKWTIPTMSE